MTQISNETNEAVRKTASRRKRQSATKSSVDEQAKATKEVKAEVVTEAPVAVPPVSPVRQAHAAVKPELNPEDYVTVRNGFNGKLVYRSRNTNEVYIWDGLGAEQEMELRELKHARNTARAYFSNNWFMFDDPAIPDWLGVSMYYKDALDIDEIDDLFTLSPAEIERTIRSMPAGQKETIANRAKDLLRTGEKIDSIRVIHALERSLGITLSITPSLN